ncbi:MAG: VPDSG-CTERM sorting domain-containing protein [Opitutaceae bacterium]|nr:VPDSG-CTERM sorting domain-containing protein [Opitutaceae bacterium]
MDASTTNASGGLGQFAIGTFVADGSTQVVTLAQGSSLNAMQLRNISNMGVPDGGSTAGLIGLALAALAVARA